MNEKPKLSSQLAKKLKAVSNEMVLRFGGILLGIARNDLSVFA